MKVTLIDYTGINAVDPEDYAARLLVYVKNTRLEQGEETRQKVQDMSPRELMSQLEAISNTIRSSWEFVTYTFEVLGVSRAYTHQQVRSRHMSFAQQAMRVADMSEFEALEPEQVAKNDEAHIQWKSAMQVIAQAYRGLRRLGISAQDARGILPTNVLTNIIIHLNLRTFADLVGKRDNLRVQDEYQQVVRLMKQEVLKVHPWTEMFIQPTRQATPQLDELLRQSLDGSSPVDKPFLNDCLKEVDKLKATWG